MERFKEFANEGKKNKKKNNLLDPYGEENWNENPLKEVHLKLKKYQVDLLIKLLNDYTEERGDMGCNDPDRREERLVPPSERIEFCRAAHRRDPNWIEEMLEDEGDVWLFNSDFPGALKQLIEDQN